MAIILAEEVWIFVAERQVVPIMTATHARQRRLIFQNLAYAESLKRAKRRWIKPKICFCARRVTLRRETVKRLRLSATRTAFSTKTDYAKRTA